jgi:hypothetical protein
MTIFEVLKEVRKCASYGKHSVVLLKRTSLLNIRNTGGLVENNGTLVKTYSKGGGTVTFAPSVDWVIGEGFRGSVWIPEPKTKNSWIRSYPLPINRFARILGES